ncbi:TetR/AcrR family transcriptional regulator [bacterium]|nr:MAG: TetR/AcrR family transcriptional regulator [bacterium]
MSEQLNRKQAILEAAGTIVAEQGSHDLTLDAIVKKLGISKGGLLYHFPTKDALIEAVIEHFLQKFDDFIADEMSTEEDRSDSPVAGRWLRAYVEGCTAQSEIGAISRAIVAVSLTDPKFMAPMQQAYERWHQHAHSDGISPDVTRLVCMAADGCWLYALYELEPTKSSAHLETLRHQLLSLINEDAYKATP